MTGHKTTTPTPLAALSHEFRTPLNGVLGMARLLEGTRLTAEQKAYVAALKESGDHLLALVNDVLDLAKLDAGALTLDPAPVSLEALLESVAEILSPRAHAKGLEIAWATPAGLPTVMADAGRLKQVLFNLAGNAVKFTECGGVFLGVESLGEPAAGKVRLRLFVRDTGPGVAPERQTEIFEAFTHDGARSDSAGLGLAIVQRLAQAHGGRVGVSSAPPNGATFWFEADYDVARRPQSRRPLDGLTVGIVSPSAIVREAAARQIEAAGGSVIVCHTAEEANRKVPQGCAVLVDTAKGRRLRPLSGRPSLVLLPPEARARLARSRNAGFAGYLIKPLRPASLVERILAVLGCMAEHVQTRPDERAHDEAARGAQVLLVEDNPINALLASKLLEREGCAVERVETAEAALDAVKSRAFDLILMDRRLPGMDGLAGAKALRKAGIDTPIVALTADAFEDDRRACLDAGMEDFLVKPLDPNALRAVLSRRWTKAPEDAKLAS